MNRYAIELIERYEGCRLDAYLDGGGIPTIGWGHTGPEVNMGLVWTQQQADDARNTDLLKAETKVRKYCHVVVGPEAIGGMMSFAYNLGGEALAKSEWMAALNKHQYLDAAKLMLHWDHDNGNEIKGLLIRRMDEAMHLLRGV